WQGIIGGERGEQSASRRYGSPATGLGRRSACREATGMAASATSARRDLTPSRCISRPDPVDPLRRDLTPGWGRVGGVSGARLLFDGLIDYAGLFPPAALPLAEVVARYGAYRRAATGWMLGRLVVPIEAYAAL